MVLHNNSIIVVDGLVYIWRSARLCFISFMSLSDYSSNFLNVQFKFKKAYLTCVRAGTLYSQRFMDTRP